MRRTLCVGRSTSIPAMRHALNRTPVFDVWIPRMLNFWNRILQDGGNNFLAQSLHSQLQEPGSWGNQVLHLNEKLPGGHTLPIDTYGRPTKIEQVTIKAIVESLVKREFERDRILVKNLTMGANRAHTSGTLEHAWMMHCYALLASSGNNGSWGHGQTTRLQHNTSTHLLRTRTLYFMCVRYLTSCVQILG